MARFKYKPIDLGGPSFRLIRLFKGEDGPIQCELFDAWLHDAEEIMEYEALSYTWGGTEKPYEVEINKKRMSVTDNLSLALRHLRYQHQDRILWIDAICIDQENDKERGHQVQQMASIYKRAERVIIWLGGATAETDLILRFMNRLEEERIKHACNKWKSSDKRWSDIWSSVQPLLGDVQDDLMFRQRKGLASLLGRSWFRRVWIIQEVANARAAEVVCGTKSVSARIFALIPSLVGMTPDVHCQAVLDIMPGSSRNNSWWSQKRDLHTLLLKFNASEASDPRDIIYALLGISSDGHNTDTLVPNYEKSVQEAICDTISFLLHYHDCESPINCLPRWTLAEFLQNLESLSNAVFDWAIEGSHRGIVELLMHREDVDVNWKGKSGRPPLWRTADRGDKQRPDAAMEGGRRRGMRRW
ncbi:HET-domain-containing protein [Lindgomyces ingoldianus]|uniref:HET-domain-containing protein n=1 Tax=Lindgomyces ingoldianus TaxID=673940 RepID=A0ACB6R7T9_9PLEO|nr:HET-domain-containing protein [Lindgomyces ingoldianus]KAF2474382.1 HET-domain-containing protein [Lindgomyces ingoldianus]